MEELLSIAKDCVKKAKSEGAEFADTVVIKTKKIRIELERGGIKSCDSIMDEGTSTRVFINGARGFSSSMGIEKDLAIETVKRATDLSKLAEPDPDFVTLPQSGESKEVDGLFDKDLAQLDAGEVVKFAIKSIDAAKGLCKDVILRGSIELTVSFKALVNSLGIEEESKTTIINSGLSSIIKRENDDIGSFWDFDSARNLSDFAYIKVAKKATEKALGYLGAKKIETKTLPIVLGPVSTYFLFDDLCHCLNAEHIQRKRSFMIGKIHKKLAPDFLTIIDDPHFPKGWSSQGTDDEGTPTKTLTLIENGIVKSYLHNSYTAHKAKEPNTGHAARYSYRGGVGISPTNIQVTPGKKTSAEIINEVTEGIYLDMASLSPHIASGDISATIDFGMKIEGGKITYPIKNGMIGTNIFDLLNNIDAISSDFREFGGNIMPSIRIQGIRIAGSK